MSFRLTMTISAVIAAAAGGALGIVACASGSAAGPRAEHAESAEHDHHTGPQSAPEATEYTCPMHPNVVRTEPGSCPICGMNLEPRVHGEEHHPSTPADAGATTTPAPTAAQTDLLTAERAAYDRARPVFERHCAKCHTTAGRNARRALLSHFNMDAYPLGGHHAAEIGATIREVLGATGEPPSMPRDNKGAVRGDELALILAWAEAFDRAHPAHEHHEHGEGHGDGHEHKH